MGSSSAAPASTIENLAAMFASSLLHRSQVLGSSVSCLFLSLFVTSILTLALSSPLLAVV